eukprot:g335.t1
MLAKYGIDLNAPTAIPGWSFLDVGMGTKGLSFGGHSLDKQDPLLKNVELHRSCKEWMKLSQKELKAKCKAAKLEISGNKKVLALRLGFKTIYPDYLTPTSYKQADAALKKRKAEAAKKSKPGKTSEKKKKKRKSLSKKSAAEVENVANAEDSGDHHFDKVVRDIQTVLRNADEGDCPLPIDTIWLQVSFPEFSMKGSISLTCNVNHARYCIGDRTLNVDPPSFETSDTGLCVSEDARVFSDMCESGILPFVAKLLKVNLNTTSKKVLNARKVAAKMVEVATTKALCKKWVNVEVWDEDICEPKTKDRLKTRFAAWLKGVKWYQTFLSHMYRPSMAAFEGYAWEGTSIMKRECGLGRDLSGSCVLDLRWEMGTSPEKIAAEAEEYSTRPEDAPSAKMFIPIWSRKLVRHEENGPMKEIVGTGTVGISDAIRKGMAMHAEALQAALKAQAQTKKRKTKRKTK